MVRVQGGLQIWQKVCSNKLCLIESFESDRVLTVAFAHVRKITAVEVINPQCCQVRPRSLFKPIKRHHDLLSCMGRYREKRYTRIQEGR